MGGGIGIVSSAVLKAQVKFVDPSSQSIDKCKTFVQNWADKEVKKERMSEGDKKDFLARISYHEKLDVLKDSEIIMEAVSEDF
mmetsp:Transcript_49078/g.36136  ORF Transcript_49078/g.36136 Transcript_49078/m.36136 type:complete len:83 (+) Transcript_49078:3-251(+)